jgi:metal-sulfur cluster biosynthetic enzyme/nitrite reductase/ring-hydroxylating ferredoxin subunit
MPFFKWPIAGLIPNPEFPLSTRIITFMTATMTNLWERVADLTELSAGGRKSIFIDDLPALLVRVGEQYFAIEDVCSHDGQPLTDGPLSDGAIKCPRHGARFELATGKPLCMPATEGVQTFAVEVRADGIYAAPQGATPSQTVTTTAAATSSTLATGTHVSTSSPAAVTTEATPAADPNSGSLDDVNDGEIIDALRQVIDPELMVNIVDLGLVYAINYGNRKAQVDMTLTSPACPAGPQIVSQAKMVIERLAGIDEATIKLTMSPPWTPDRMTDEARDQLGFF